MRISRSVFGLLLLLSDAAARADITHIGTGDPTTEGWTPAGAGTGVVSVPTVDTDFGLPAWRIHDPSSALGSALAFQAPGGEVPAANDFWTYTARLRVANMMLPDEADFGVFLEVTDTSHRRYVVMFGATQNGMLNIVLSPDGDPTFPQYQIAPVQHNRSDYVWVELAHAPGSTAVSLFVNGVLRTNAYHGFSAPSVPGRILWGSGSSAQQGQGYYNFIHYTKGSAQACGNGIDDDDDLLVDLADPNCASALDPREDGPVIPCDDGVDTDGDLVCDADEPELGTDPAEADSDGDGLADGSELLSHGTDPLEPDGDGDGLVDGAEIVTYGSDPHVGDSDADGLVDGAEAAVEIFVTASAHTGNLGGLAGGDAICVAEAQGLSLLRADGARAWLSDASEDARDRIPTGPYRSRAFGHVVAKDLADLTDGLLFSQIGGASIVWTGTNVWGTEWLGMHCLSWTTALEGPRGRRGIAPTRFEAWTDDANDSCILPRHLYCFVPALGSDPTDVDTDGDGFEDGDEVAAGTDPVDAGDPPPVVPALPTAALGFLAAALALAGASAARRLRR